ncbi:MAG: hypothetical protein IPH44_21855 [Myxococcales bacterium]|jgi:hypothetical protein|nr:hypothetical protein [Myxococcales bacterium]MBK7192005.1 hypothetical protein [Myxococcales bacterium]MBP6842158.1 hypothetical protein [Kofleriaceae bacterium]
MRTSSCFVVVVLGLAACGKGESKPAAPPPTSATAGTAGTGAAAPTPSAAPAAAAKLLGSCAIADIACSDYYGSGDVTPIKSACDGVGTWSDGPCRAGAVGTCTKTEAGGVINKASTYPPGTPASSKQACDNTPGGVYAGG